MVKLHPDWEAAPYKEEFLIANEFTEPAKWKDRDESIRKAVQEYLSDKEKLADNG